MKVGVVLFNLGGPGSLEEVEPFLRNLFSDPAILRMPTIFRIPLARLIARRRAPVAREIYAQLGGKSPILEQTSAQARALESALCKRDLETRAFVAMRTSWPGAEDAAREIAAWNPDRIVLLPLYPQFSTTTSASSFDEWARVAKRAGLRAPQSRACCYPWDRGFIAAEAALVREALQARQGNVSYRVLFSAHGLPEYVVARGDPYPWQIEQSVKAIVAALDEPDLDWRLCYQSRVGPLKWLQPGTDEEIKRAGADGKGVIVVPVAFVSEHSETLVELDIEYGKLAKASGVPHYIRVPTVSVREEFIEGLAELVMKAVAGDAPVTCGTGRICPSDFRACGYHQGAV